MRRTLTSRRWIRGLLGGAALATTVALVAPSGVAVAAQPGSNTSSAAGPTQPLPEPEPEPEPKPKPRLQPRLEPGPPALEPPVTIPPTAPTPPPEVVEPDSAEAARAAEELAREQAADAAEAAAEAAEAAAQRAAAEQRAQASWAGRGRPNKMIIIRRLSVDVVTEGRLTGQVPRPEGVLTLAALDGLAPSTWLSIADGAARLSAAVVLTPGTALDVGGDVQTLKLAGGATAPEAASIYTGSGRLTLHDVTVTSSDPASQQALPPTAGRPFVVVSGGGRLEATDVTFSDLGTPHADADYRAGVQFNPDSGGSLVRTSMLRNSTGLKLSRSQDVRLEGVTVGESASDGLVLQGDRGTAMSEILAERNAGNGVLVKGESTDRPISGITTTGNRAFGVAVVGQAKPQISRIVTAGDGLGGLRVNRSTEVVVTDLTATDQPIGVFTHVGSNGLVLDQLRIAGGRRGVVVEKTTVGLELRGTTIEGATVVGVAVGGRDVELREVSVSESRTGVRIERGAAGVTTVGLTLSGGEDGFVATPGSTQVVLQDVVTVGVENDAVRTFSPNAQIIGGRVTGGGTGIVAGAATAISGTAITQVDEGISARSGELVHADRVDVAALASGINVAPGSRFLLTGSRVEALEAVRGEVTLQGFNDLSLPPLNLLGAIGVPLILLAVALELVHTLRQRSFGGDRRRLPPLTVPVGA